MYTMSQKHNDIKNELDNFWQNQEVKYNCKASFTGIGNTSALQKI